MANLKLSALLVVFAGVALASPVLEARKETRTDEHNYYACSNYDTDKELLYSKKVYESGTFLAYKIQTVTYPEGGVGVNSKKITCISIQDLDENDKGGYPTIISGGLNQYSAQIQLKSQLGRGLNFNVELYTDAE